MMVPWKCADSTGGATVFDIINSLILHHFYLLCIKLTNVKQRLHFQDVFREWARFQQ